MEYFYLNGARFFLFGQNIFDTFYRIESESEKQHIALKIISPWNSISYGPTEAPPVHWMFVCLFVCVRMLHRIAYTGKTFQNNNISTFYSISLLVECWVCTCVAYIRFQCPTLKPMIITSFDVVSNCYLFFCVLPFCRCVCFRVCVCVCCFFFVLSFMFPSQWAYISENIK